MPPSDLRHRLNVLRHKPISEQPGFILIAATSIPGYNRLDKINYIKDLFHNLNGYVDLNWKYHDRSAAIIIEFNNQTTSSQATYQISASHPDLELTQVTDLRQILHRSNSTNSHNPRFQERKQDFDRCEDQKDHTHSHSHIQDYTYRLRHVPSSLSHMHIQANLSYYGRIACIQEVEQLPPTRREILITFDDQAKLSLLNHIWSVNIQGYNISIAQSHLPESQLDYRKKHVAGFKGFHYKTTESQALRLF